jgi:hypothetical protein
MTQTASERRLEELARGLGQRAAGRVDPDRTADAVVAALQRDGRRRGLGRWRAVAPLATAAAVMVMIGSAVVVGSLRQVPAATVAAAAPPELLDLGIAELGQVLDSLDAEAPVSEMTARGWYDLSEAELRELLTTLEG